MHVIPPLRICLAGCLTGVLTCLSFLLVHAILTIDNVFSSVELGVALFAPAAAGLIAARLCSERKIILIIIAYLTLLFPLLGPLFGSSGSEPLWQFALLGLVGGLLWSLPVGTVRLIRLFL